MNKITEKIVLGTAQFGLDYGINNKTGKMPDEELQDVLNLCLKNELKYLDTAYSYGDSEERIGKFIKENKCNLKIITKLPYCSAKEVENIVNTSLSRLNTNTVYGYLIHNVETIKKNPDTFFALCKIKEKGLIEKIGFSLYDTNELEALLTKKINFDIIQIPYNIFDRRFESYFELLKGKNIELHTRSVFLQGLFFIEPEKLNSEFFQVKEKIEIFNEISKKSGIPKHVLCLSFVMINSFVDKVIVGVDGNKHLLELLSSGQKINEAFNLFDELRCLREDNPDIILPYRWRKTV